MDFDAVRLLLDSLSGRNAPLLVKLDENDCIVAAHYSYDSEYDIGIVFRHPEGAIDIGINVPEGLDEMEGVVWSEQLETNLSDGLPGLAILEQLKKGETEKLGLRYVDMGGPASGEVPMVKYSGEMKTLQKTLEKESLLFRFPFGLELLQD